MTEKTYAGMLAMTKTKKNTVIIVQYCKVWPMLIIQEHKTYFQSAKVTFI
jgi:hypothetical protein